MLHSHFSLTFLFFWPSLNLHKQSYQDYHCSEEEAHMECEVDPQMSLTAVTHAKWYG